MELVAYLNSKIAWFFLSSVTNIARGGYLRLRTEFVEKVPIPSMATAQQAQLTKTGAICTDKAVRRFNIKSSVRHRILDLASPERQKLSRKLDEWWMLDFAAFRAEVKRLFHTEIPVNAQNGKPISPHRQPRF
jgi:hypothetical protein